MNKSKWLITLDYFLDILVFGLFYLLLRKVKLSPGDDFVYQNILNGRSFLVWLNELYQVWSGRVVLTGLLVYLLNAPLIVWRILNSLMFTVLARYASKLSSNAVYFKAILFSLFILMPEAVINSGAMWIAGSLNYLWPISMMVYLLYLLEKRVRKVSVMGGLMIFLALVLATNNEQSSLVLLVFYGLIILYDFLYDRSFERNELIIFGAIGVGFGILMLAPGNFTRLNIEILGLNPAFKMLDLYDKLMIGVQFAFNVLFNGLRYHLLIISTVLLFVSFKQSKRLFAFSLIQFTLIVFKVLFDLYIRYNPYCTACNDLHYVLYNFRYFDIYNLTQFIHLIPTLLGFIYLVSIILNYFALIEVDFRKKLFNSLILMSGLASAIILGFSPTIEASGHRIFFLMSVNIVLFTAQLLARLDTKKHRYLFWLLCFTIIIFATLRVNTLLQLEVFEVMY